MVNEHKEEHGTRFPPSATSTSKCPFASHGDFDRKNWSRMGKKPVRIVKILKDFSLACSSYGRFSPFCLFALSRNKVMHTRARLSAGKRQLRQREFKVAFSLT